MRPRTALVAAEGRTLSLVLAECVPYVPVENGEVVASVARTTYPTGFLLERPRSQKPCSLPNDYLVPYVVVLLTQGAHDRKSLRCAPVVRVRAATLLIDKRNRCRLVRKG